MEPAEMKKLTIKRSEWVRGEGPWLSKLFTSKGKRCCLGFFGNSLGIPDREMKEIGSPGKFNEIFRNEIFRAKTTLFPEILDEFSVSYAEFIEANDDESISSYDRERILKGLFKRIGVEAEFVNE